MRDVQRGIATRRRETLMVHAVTVRAVDRIEKRKEISPSVPSIRRRKYIAVKSARDVMLPCVQAWCLDMCG